MIHHLMTKKSRSKINKEQIGLFMTVLILPKALHTLGVLGLLFIIAVTFLIKKILWLIKSDKELEDRLGIRKIKSHTDTKSIS